MNNPKLLVQCGHEVFDLTGIRAPHPCGMFGSDITLLDLFAGMAMHAYIQMSGDRFHKERIAHLAEDRSMQPDEFIVNQAYSYAKLMLKERDKTMKGESDAEKTI